MAVFFFFFFNDTATTEIYTLSLHDALPIFELSFAVGAIVALLHDVLMTVGVFALLGRELTLTMVGAVLTIAGYSINDTIVVYDRIREGRSEEHTSELQSQSNLVCRLLLEKKKK